MGIEERRMSDVTGLIIFLGALFFICGFGFALHKSKRSYGHLGHMRQVKHALNDLHIKLMSSSGKNFSSSPVEKELNGSSVLFST